ncbi:YcaO-like family protein [Streptomyces sp. NPDC055607]
MPPATDITTVRPRLRSQVFFVPSPDGAHLVDGERVVTVRASWAYPLLERISPHLTGDLTVAELTRSLSQEKRIAVERLISLLRNENFIRDLSLDRPHRLSAEELRTYGAEVAFVESFVDSAPYRFETWRESRLLLIGSGPVLEALAGAVLRCGVREAEVIALTDRATDLDRVEEHRALAAERDPRQRLVVRTAHASSWDDGTIAAEIERNDVVLHGCGLPCFGHAESLDILCERHGARLVQAVVHEGEAWIGPASRPDRPETRWRAAWPRVRDSAPAPAGSPVPSGEEGGLLTGPPASIIANHLLFTAFNEVTGVTPEEDGPTMTRLDLETLSGETHTVVPHPFALDGRPSGAEDTAARVADLSRGGTVEDETFSRAVVNLIDPRTGILGPFDESDLPQLPLRVTQVPVAGPAGLLRGKPVVVNGAALDFEQARLRAARQALAVHASLVVDPRRRLPSGKSRQEAAVYGVRLRDGEAVPVSERAAFPAWYRVRAGLPYGRPVGLAAAPSWNEAVEQALLDHFCELATTEAFEGTESRHGTPPRLDPSTVPLDQEGRQMLRLLEVARRRVDVLDLTGGCGVPVYAFLLDGTTVVRRAGLSTAEAVREGLRATLLAHQARVARRPDLMPRQGLRLPPRTGAEEAPTAGVKDLSPGSGTRLETLMEMLSATGRQAVVVPLDADPAVSAVLPFIVQVVVCDV